MNESGGPRGRLSVWAGEAATALRRQEGQTLVEYALLTGFIAIGSVAAIIALGPAIGEAVQVVGKVIEDYMVL